MPTRRIHERRQQRLPASICAFFWDYPRNKLNWETDRELITSRLLSTGDWAAIGWLRRRIGDDGLREWICRRCGAGLSARQLRFWELVLGLPRRQVNSWLKAPDRIIWDCRGRV